jgi:endo-beta-N-acetylglucosaminidase D
MMSEKVGWLDRSADSVLPQQSWNSSHTSAGLVVVSSAFTMREVYRMGNASALVMMVANRKKSRREIPRRDMAAHTPSSRAFS